MKIWESVCIFLQLKTLVVMCGVGDRKAILWHAGHVKLNNNANNRNRKKTEKMLNEKKMLNDVVSETNIVKPDNKISFDKKESRHLCREIF